MTTATQNQPLSEIESVSTDDVLDVLAKERRREVLSYLIECTDPVTVDALVAHVESAGQAGIGNENENRLAVRFHHVDLPKMAAAGLVEYDREENVVEATAACESIEATIQLL